MAIQEKVLILGACGQIGTELTTALRKQYGNEQVITSDIRQPSGEFMTEGPHIYLDILNQATVEEAIKEYQITQIYHLAAILSAKGESNPRLAWDINMNGLLNVLDACVNKGIKKIFWPSSIAVFGKKTPVVNSHQYTVTDPYTVYGISKLAGELWCQHYHVNKKLDIRSLRYPGLISYVGEPGGGTTDYAVQIFYAALQEGKYECYLEADSCLPMMYMPDAIKATLQLMHVPENRLSVRTSYNIAAFSFTPEDLTDEIKKYIPGFSISYAPDFRREIARNWPASVDDQYARDDWDHHPDFTMADMVKDMLHHVGEKIERKMYT